MDEFCDLEAFSKRLQGLRERTRPVRSRRVVSELCGLHTNAISRYERGEALPDADTLFKLADYYGVSMDWLWTGKNF